MVNFADAGVGNLTELLKAKGMYENTIIVFSADNGGPIYNNGTAGANNCEGLDTATDTAGGGGGENERETEIARRSYTLRERERKRERGGGA